MIVPACVFATTAGVAVHVLGLNACDDTGPGHYCVDGRLVQGNLGSPLIPVDAALAPCPAAAMDDAGGTDDADDSGGDESDDADDGAASEGGDDAGDATGDATNDAGDASND
jgi:hypothetical protein